MLVHYVCTYLTRAAVLFILIPFPTQEMLKTKLDNALIRLGEQKEKWRSRLDGMSAKASRASSRVNDEKAKARRLVQQQLDSAAIQEMELADRTRELEEMNRDIKVDRRTAVKDKLAATAATKSRDIARNLAQRRLAKYLEEKEKKYALQDVLARVVKAKAKQGEILERYTKELEISRRSMKKLKKTRMIGRKGGRSWDVWVVQVCCELLVSGTPPAAIPSSIGSLYETFYGEAPDELPSVNFVRQCRITVQIVGETITAMKLAGVDNWKEIVFDATTRRQVPFQAVVIGLMTDGVLDPVIVSSCIFLEDESSEVQAAGVVSKVWHMFTCRSMLYLVHSLPITLLLSRYIHITD